MTKAPRTGTPHSSPLPPHFGIVAVDAMGSTRLPSIAQGPLSATITDLVRRALEAAELGDMPREFETNTGDGLSFGCDPVLVPYLVSPFVDELNAHLLWHNVGPQPPVRLRMSVHIGPLPVAPGRAGDGNAAARGESQRLLDSEPVRRRLKETDPRATPLVAVLSDRVYDTVVRGGYCGLPPARFTEVLAEVAGKDFRQTAWMYVPTPSGDMLRQAAATTDPAASGQSPAAPNHARGAADPAPAEAGPPPARHQHVESGVAVMDCAVRDVHHHTAPRQDPGHP
ncbi:hypothetical protein OYE22_17355 [Streptomyces sp. 71268]|uniref:hypothetical protein n=1 Tax=Streptomyces sp. 71268 TaxID=3002640 RepID=UPI0023FA1AC8|nr:hypothetical protein [Streptomyces sp. 71268]WEV26769.1 hypothetical protein OYE22_17355 [Streptomyces sp. 71268]